MTAVREPRLVLMFTEQWTLIDPRDLRGLVELAVIAEDVGADGVLVGEHVAMGPSAGRQGVPDNPRDWLRPGTQDPRYPHPSGLHLLSAIASLTTKLRLIAAALISPLRHPLVVAKELATLDLVSRGRLVCMPSVSWQEEEYAALGVPYNRRGEILDEQLEVWERAWRDKAVGYRGRHFSFEKIGFEPKPWRETGPGLWIGGDRLHSAALRRILRHSASGFFPNIPPSDDDLERLRGALVDAGRSWDDFELVTFIGLGTPFPDAASPKPLGPSLDAVAPELRRGATTFVLKPSMFVDDADQLGDLCREALAGLRERSSAQETG